MYFNELPQTVVLFYIDPGTGSMVIQILIGMAIGALYYVKIYWGRIKAFFRRKHE